MKKYIEPMIDVTEFDVEDIITESAAERDFTEDGAEGSWYLSVTPDEYKVAQ